MSNGTWTRRDLVKLALVTGLTPAITAADEMPMIQRTIPASGEKLPVIGLGTYSVFDVDSTPENIASRRTVLDLLLEKGGSLIDTSPMYNRSEKVIGDIVDQTNIRASLFVATKVWTDGKASGIQQMTESARLLKTDAIDLMQVHNRRDLDTHMATIRDWQDAKRIRYSGVTDYRSSALDDLAAAMESQKPDFIQINYSLGEPEADEYLLPMAADLGIAVIINRPFVAGRLFRSVGNRALPNWAAGFADSWGQFFLKYIISHPAVTCVIPATGKVHHMADNLGAGFGLLPDSATRRRMEDFVSTL